MTEDQKNEIISKCRRADHSYLYFMVFIIFMHSCMGRSPLSRCEVESVVRDVMAEQR